MADYSGREWCILKAFTGTSSWQKNEQRKYGTDSFLCSCRCHCAARPSYTENRQVEERREVRVAVAAAWGATRARPTAHFPTYSRESELNVNMVSRRRAADNTSGRDGQPE